MARETTYVVQAFNAGESGKLKPEFSDRLQIGKWRPSNGGKTRIEQIRRRCILVYRRPRDGRL